MCRNLKNMYFKQFDLIILGMQKLNFIDLKLNINNFRSNLLT